MNLSARGGVAINGTATLPSLWLNKKDIEEVYQTTKTNLNQYPLEQVLGWHNVCLETAYQYKTSAIEDVHFDHGVDFNFVLIDGSPFSGESELRCVRPFLADKAIIALDDVNDIKNYANHEKLKRTATLLWEDMACRNGAAIFQLC